MTEPEAPNSDIRPISVAELLAKNGSIGAPATTRRRRRRRGDSETVTVAELTGVIPAIDDDFDQEADEHPADEGVDVAEPVAQEPEVADEPAPEVHEPEVQEDTTEDDDLDIEDGVYWSEPEPRWPKSPPQQRKSGPERSAYPRPLPHGDEAEPKADGGAAGSGAEGMSPDPVGHYGDMAVDVMDSEVTDADAGSEDSAYVRSYLEASEGTLFGGQTLADEMARRRSDERAEAAESARDSGDDFEAGHRNAMADLLAHEDRPDARSRGRLEGLWRGSLVVLQSILAVAFGAGLFIAFDQLWRWNSIVTLVLSVLVILGLVVGVRVVRKTEDIASTLIAVAVGLLITLGPLVLSLQAG
jgi:hypothetical protein